MTTVAFYIEPAVFRRDPAMFVTWANWVADIAVHNISIDFVLISSGAVCAGVSPPTNLRLIEVNIKDVLAIHDFSISKYVMDLVNTRKTHLFTELLQLLQNIEQKTKPDIVISFTENRYLKAAFPESEILFTELGSLPQITVPPTLFFDPIGHQTGLLNACCTRIIELPSPLGIEESDALWDAHRAKKLQAHPMFGQVYEWFNELSAKHVVLLVLQPADHPNYCMFDLASRPDEIVRRVAAQRQSAVVVPTFHKDDVFSRSMKASILHDCPNAMFPPEILQSGLSELMVGLVQEIVTFSSNAGFTAILEGTPVTTLSMSRFTELAEYMKLHSKGSVEHRALRRNLLAIFSNGYLNDLTDLTSVPENFSLKLARVDKSSRIESYFDFSNWTLNSIAKMLGVGSGQM